MQHARIGNRNPGVGDESIAGDKPFQRIQPHGTDLLADGFDAAAGEPPRTVASDTSRNCEVLSTTSTSMRVTGCSAQ